VVCETRHRGPDFSRLGSANAPELSIAAICETFFSTLVPNETARWIVIVIIVEVHTLAAALGVGAGPKLLYVLGRNRAVGPEVACRTDLSVVIQVIDQSELTCDGVLVWRRLFSEDRV
jgi:hypothetical protein